MKLISEVGLPDLPFRLNHHEKILMMGSCFTDQVGRMLDRYRFPVCINPFGTVFNPLSVKSGLEALLEKDRYETDDLEQYKGTWFSFDHYTMFSDPDRDRCLERINKAFLAAGAHLAESSILVLTWGTAWVYTRKADGRVVSNCHKIPEKEFKRRRLQPREIAEAYRAFIPALLDRNPHLKILLTVSPVRHLKDGAHGNQLSKASLLLAADQLVEIFPEQVFYFPSYEIVLDELRDYRFYATDLVHTNDLATAYIWEKIRETLVSEESREIIMDLEPYLKLREHRPGDTSEKALQNLESQIGKKRKIVLEKYPFIDL